MDAGKATAASFGEALACLAAERGLLHEVQADLETARQAIKLPELSRFLASPLVPRQAKTDLIDRIFAGRATEEFRTFLKVVVEKRCGSLMREILRAGFEECLKMQGIELVRVTSAAPLGEEERAVIGRRLTTAFGDRLYLEFRTSPGLIGGMVIRRGNRVLDASVLGLTYRLRESLAGDFRAQ